MINLLIKIVFFAVMVTMSLNTAQGQAIDAYTGANRVTVPGAYDDMVAYTTVYIDYSINYYYDVGASVANIDSDDRSASNAVGCGECGSASATAHLSYNASASYEAIGDYTVTLVYVSTFGNDPYGYTYYNDLANDGSGLYMSLSYGFLSRPSQTTGLTNLFLGSVFAFVDRFTEQASGKPDHLIVVEDKTEDNGPCGQLWRKIKFRIVDTNHKPACPRCIIGELRSSAPVSTCTGATVDEAQCPTGSNGAFLRKSGRDSTFTDNLRVGCPASSDACGFLIPDNRWTYCPDTGRAAWIVLAKMKYEIRKRSIKVNDSTVKIDAGTKMYSDGHVEAP
jgi:hypothetical protein